MLYNLVQSGCDPVQSGCDPVQSGCDSSNHMMAYGARSVILSDELVSRVTNCDDVISVSMKNHQILSSFTRRERERERERERAT